MLEQFMQRFELAPDLGHRAARAIVGRAARACRAGCAVRGRGPRRAGSLELCRRRAGLGAERALQSDFADVFFRALDSETFFVEQALDEPQRLQVLRRVKAMLGVSVARPQKRELGFPKTQHVGFNADGLGRLTDLQQLFAATAAGPLRARSLAR